jgi:hypothetical protein
VNAVCELLHWAQAWDLQTTDSAACLDGLPLSYIVNHGYNDLLTSKTQDQGSTVPNFVPTPELTAASLNDT